MQLAELRFRNSGEIFGVDRREEAKPLATAENTNTQVKTVRNQPSRLREMDIMDINLSVGQPSFAIPTLA
jgi:hypothetical protein